MLFGLDNRDADVSLLWMLNYWNDDWNSCDLDH